MVSVKKSGNGFAVRRRKQSNREQIGLVAAGVSVGLFVAIVFSSMGDDKVLPPELTQKAKHPHIGELLHSDLPDNYNAIAEDIYKTLDCEKILNVTSAYGYARARRLTDAGFGDDMPNDRQGGRGAWADSQNARPVDTDRSDNGQQPDSYSHDGMMDDLANEEEFGEAYVDIDGKHLVCAAATDAPPKTITSNMRCDAAGSKRRALLDLWSDARAEIMDKTLLVKSLELAREQQSCVLLNSQYHLWAPAGDNGLQYSLNVLNQADSFDNGGIQGLQGVLGQGKLFVDVGSGQGLTSMVVSQLYPGTKIVSIEPAQPNWLMQHLNLRCNLEHDQWKKIHVVLGGVGHNNDDEDSLMATFMWNPYITTATRFWTPASEFSDVHVELIVKLRQIKSLLAQANIFGQQIDVLNLDCEGCEYNLVPQMPESEFNAIPTVIGKLHWGYIPTKKLPSSVRAEKTHKRLCAHENIAKVSKECCAFPDMLVKSNSPGEVLKRIDEEDPINQATVSDVAGSLCDGFAEWANGNYLFDVKSDWNWFQLSSTA